MSTNFSLPDVSDPMERHPKAPAPGDPFRLHHDLCHGCGVNAPGGLHVTVYAGEGFTTTAEMKVEEWMLGGPGVIHGGVLTAAFDEVLGTTPLIIGVPVVTGHLEVDFLKPIPIGSTLHFEAEVAAKERRKVFVRAVARLDDSDEPVATASAIFIEIDLRKHYAKYYDSASQSRL
ncbi:PaaI family thioesterase [Gordonia alkaliphila]|uniref:Acyl-coenzyme A thioesterase THEM4 n=1 Tax=Gordonia alkaliphila TaxID=1053547 RepID=A0ABP8Z2P7_9ACTN